jgi:hypothetical protein
VDETHHLLPADWNPASLVLAQKLSCMIYVTVHPEQIERSVLNTIDTLIALGEAPDKTIARFCEARAETCPPVPQQALAPGEAVVWRRTAEESPFKLRIAPSEMDRRRHRRKYAEGELPPDRSFYFRGPSASLNLRAQNLILFAQIADGVDDATWEYHLRCGDYSHWFADGIKDEALAEAARRIEKRTDLAPVESRRLMRAAIEEHYTVPAKTDRRQ